MESGLSKIYYRGEEKTVGLVSNDLNVRVRPLCLISEHLDGLDMPGSSIVRGIPDQQGMQVIKASSHRWTNQEIYNKVRTFLLVGRHG
jgi:hypothetical protein